MFGQRKTFEASNTLFSAAHKVSENLASSVRGRSIVKKLFFGKTTVSRFATTFSFFFQTITTKIFDRVRNPR